MQLAEPLPDTYGLAAPIKDDLAEPIHFAKVKWEPYTDPKTGRKGRISEGGQVRYDEPAPTKPSRAAPELADPIPVSHLEGSEKGLNRTFHEHGVKKEDLPGLIGAGAAPPGTEVKVTELTDGALVVMSGDWGKAERLIQNNGIIKNDNIEINPKFRGQGVGSAIFSDQVRNAVKHGFKEIRAFASGGPGEPDNGYYTWPRLGFDGELPESVLDRLPDRFMGEDIFMVSDLMKTKAGRDWWRYNGEPLSLKFDLSEGSQSRKVLDAYMKKAAKKPKPPAAAARSAPKPKAPTIEQVQSMLGDDKARNRSIAKSVLSFGSLEAAYEHFSDPETFGADRLGRAMAEAIYLDPKSDAAHLVSRIAAPKPYAKVEEEDELGTLDLSPREEEALDMAWDSVGLADPIEADDAGPIQHAADGWTIVRYGKAELADWVEEKAPRAKSGRRWRNTKTGKVRYDQPKGWEKKNEEAPADKKPEPAKPPKPGELPEGWTSASRGGIATNKDPVHGGIVDRAIASGEWFVIPENEAIGTLEGFKSREEAIAALEEAVRNAGEKGKPEPEGGLADPIPEGPGPDASPREQAEFDTKQQLESSEYQYARESAVPNAGEDLLGSARHKRNAWRGLAEAEKEGTAEALITRDKLLENEPLDLISKVGDGRNALSCLAAHLVMKTFPPSPEGKYGSRAEDKAKHRAEYLQAYLLVKNKVEELAVEEPHPLKLIDAVHTALGNRIEELRKQQRYSPMANQLIAMYNRTAVKGWSGGFWSKFKQTNAGFGIMQFTELLKKKFGEEINADTLKKSGEIVKDILEGKSMAKAFGEQSTGKKGGLGFSAADLYVKKAERKGGKTLKFKDAVAATQYMVKDMGMRGVQWGNSVSDDERLHHAQFSAEAISDLTDILGLPASLGSVGGMIGLAIGARGKGTAMAHYEPIVRNPDGTIKPSSGVINLTRKGGVGSLAHEWGHAFDHVIAGANIVRSHKGPDGDYYSERTSAKRFVRDPSSPNGWKRDERGQMVTEDLSSDPLWKAYDDVRKSWRESGFQKRLGNVVSEAVRRGIISKGKRDYWKSGREIFARCFERYVQRKLEGAGRLNTYLSGIDKSAWEPDDEFVHGGFWPNDQEIDAMAPAFDKIFEVYRGQLPKEEKKMHARDYMERVAYAFDQGHEVTDPLEINDLDDDPYEINDLDDEDEFADDSQTPLMFSLEESDHYDAQDWIAEPAPIKGGTRWKHRVTGEVTYDDPTGGSERPEGEKNDVGRQPAAKPDEDSWVSVSLETQRAKWRQKLQSAQNDYMNIRKAVRDTGLSHQEIEADKRVQKAMKKIEAIRGKLGRLEGGEDELRAARDEMAEPMAAFAAGDITEEQLTQEVKPQIEKIAKVLGASAPRKVFEKAKAAINSDTFRTMRATWPARIASLLGTADDWLRSSFVAAQTGMPATEVSLVAWVASYVLVRGLDALKKRLGKEKPMIENKQFARDEQVPPEMVEMLHKWLSEMATAAGIQPPEREWVAKWLAGGGQSQQFAKAEAEHYERADDNKLLASILGGYAMDDYVFVPAKEPGRYLRALVLRHAGGDNVSGPSNCENVIVSDDRPGSNMIYFHYGKGDFSLRDATPIDPDAGPGALLKLIREERPREIDPDEPCQED